MAQHNSATSRIIGALVVAVVIALAVWWYFSQVPDTSASNYRGSSGPAAVTTAPPPIEHPISQAQTLPAPAASSLLPPLADSDGSVAKALAGIPGANGLAGLLAARALVPHIVATVDALPRHAALGSNILPLKTPPGSFVVDDSGASPEVGAGNYARYDRYMKIVKAVDPRTLVNWYVRWYPLFQEAYRELGYPQGYFNDRLIATIDNMLAAPNVQRPPQLRATDNGHYAFADPTWESLSAGQKLMIRIGPEHERMLKAKLRSIRALLLGRAPALHHGKQAVPSPAGSAAAG